MKVSGKLKGLILILALLSLNIGVSQAQTYITFDISKGNVVFRANKTYTGKNSAGQTVSGTHVDSNKYKVIGSTVATSLTSNTYTITVETKNLIPSATNVGCSYDITLDNVTIDRAAMSNIFSNSPSLDPNHSLGYYYHSLYAFRQNYNNGARLPFNAGDDTVDVTITLVGDNTLIGEPGTQAALQYNRYDGTVKHLAETPQMDPATKGIVGNGKLTIQGSGSLYVKKDGTMNSGACIGSAMIYTGSGASIVDNISCGHIYINLSEGGSITAVTGAQGDSHYPDASEVGCYASAIGGGACCRCSNITIESGTVTATSYATSAAIGGGGGYTGIGAHVSGAIKINGGTITTYSKGNDFVFETGVGIGAGSSNRNSGGHADRIEINGGTLNIWKWKFTDSYADGHWVYGNIGGGNSNTELGNRPGSGGYANVYIYGGTTTAGNIGGGSAHCAACIGGDANLYVDMESGSVNLDGIIGGGNSVYDNGGNATITIVKGTISAAAIGGGSSLGDATAATPIPGNGDGGTASVIVDGGTLTVSGKIGGGNSAGSGTGGNASIYVTGGTLDCGSIGGGDSNTGAPGSVSAEIQDDPTQPYYNPLGAGVYIAGNNKITVKSGYIGGGSNVAGDIGKATAYVNATHSESTLQGQFILCNNTSTTTDHCFFILENGTIDNTNLGAIGAASHPRMKANGGAVYMEDANGEVSISGGSIMNSTGTLGGAVYMTNGSFTLSGTGVFQDNTASDKGGAVYLGGGTVNITGGFIGGATIDNCNTATNYGGGLYLGGGSFEMTGGNVRNNKVTGHDGGGIYIASGGTAVLHGGIIEGNQALNGNGGGFYVNPGAGKTTTVNSDNGDTNITGNTAKNGGGAYVGSGRLYVASTNGNSVSICNNTATQNGGGLFANSHVEVTGASVCDNEAANGGGLYLPDAAVTVDFSSGSFENNYASQNGGGIYLSDNATLNLKGNATLTQNHVSANGQGGGIYLDGTLNVGENESDPAGTHSLKVEDNYAGSTTKLNNVYLHDIDDVITLLSDISGKDPVSGKFYSHIGFSVDMGFRPVIYASTAHINWLSALMGTASHLVGAIFDDAQKYIAIHVNEYSAPFYAEYIYLWACWTTAVTSDPGTDAIELVDDTYHIKSKEGLAWFISLVDGLNHREDGGHTEPGSNPYTEAKPGLKGVLEADVDMHEFLWVPIGGVGSFNQEVTPATMSSIFTAGGEYKGEFDGGGHTISGLDCRYITAIDSYGLFGNLKEGANVKNTFVKDYYFEAQDNTITYHMGGIAGTMEGTATIANCEARGRMTAKLCASGSLLGGLVGKMDGTTKIHSSIGMPDVSADATAQYIGGLVGQLTASGNEVKNSFANASFGTTTATVGGLVSKNNGTVENCYSRLRGPVPASFGYLVGDNTNGTVKYSYATLTDYTISGKEGAQEGLGTYGLTQLPYLYKHRDTQVAATNDYVPTGTDADKQLMIVLNRWVDTINSKQSAINYTKWGRPWQESDAQKPLNDDYPILKMPVGEAVATESTDPYLYYGTVDNLLTKYNAAGDAIWMYRNSESVTGDNSTSAAKLYIAEDVALLNDNALKAYVGITLDNSAGADGVNPTYFPGVTDVTDWHMIATPLSDAPIGINYDNGTYDFDYGHPSGMPYYLFYPKDDAKHGYFPSHRFGKSYPISDATIEAGNYYTEWDFYSYSEPDYHWINFKRNSASHHHMEAEDHSSIDYYGDGVNLGNETRLVPGKGYFAATREETFLQCQGHLNNGAVAYNLTQTSGVPRHGYNLIGNPYQAYLDFDAFADANSGSGDNKIWTVAQHASYTILDEDELETSINVETIMGQKPVFYRTYSYGCSSNPDVSAGGFIHPHQGFFVRLEGDKASAQAQFAPDQRNVTAKSKFRGDVHVDYPLVNLFAIEGNGAADVVTVELGRPDEGGAPLMQGLRVGNGKIWCHYNDKDYAIAYTQPGITEVGIRFETVEDTEYTMRWSTHNGDFSYLHLIDNKTGADVDCLATDEYKFSASMSDYKSRFRLVFGYTGIEEESEAEANENFAFIMNDALVVTGEGVLQVFDMTGRMVASQELHGVQTTVSLPAAANGVYVLRLTNGRQSQVQKMVISK